MLSNFRVYESFLNIVKVGIDEYTDEFIDLKKNFGFMRKDPLLNIPLIGDMINIFKEFFIMN